MSKGDERVEFVGGIVGTVLAIIVGVLFVGFGIYIVPAMFFKFVIGMMLISLGFTAIINGTIALVK